MTSDAREERGYRREVLLLGAALAGPAGHQIMSGEDAECD